MFDVTGSKLARPSRRRSANPAFLLAQVRGSRRRLHFPATDLSGPFLERVRIPASVVAVFPVGLRASWFEATLRRGGFACRLRARQRACARDSLEASNVCVSDDVSAHGAR